MNHTTKIPQSLDIATGALHSAHALNPLSVTVKSGTLWVTFDGEIRDFIVAAGETILIPRGKHAVFQALDPAHLAIQERETAAHDGASPERNDLNDRNVA